MMRRVIVAGGGTGGHLFPGIAVVEELRRRLGSPEPAAASPPGVEVLFVGTARGIEARVIPAMGERLELLEVAPLKGRRPVELLRGLGVLPGAALRAGSLVRSFRPDLVIGVGGYAAGPMLAAAAALGVPTALLEQNAHVGLTNRLLAPLVGRAYVAFEETRGRFPRGRVRVVGNPVRREFVEAARRALIDPDGFEARARHVLVMGGSQGAQALNDIVPGALADAGVAATGLRVVHQSGPAMRDEVEALYRDLGVPAEVVSFIDDMSAAYAQAALVVARAGATTVAELCAVGRPSVLVPYPYAADDHQAKNAGALEAAGATRCVREHDLPRTLAGTLRELLGDPAARRAMAEAARRHGRPEAAAAIVDDLCEWLGWSGNGARATHGQRGEAGDDPGAAARAGTGLRRPLCRARRRDSWNPAAVTRRPLVVPSSAAA